jgi:Thoeris protein ThsB, TIR-like domain
VTSKLRQARADLPERAPVAAANGGSTYDAFISYSHAADGRLAPALRNGLLRFATPWGPLRWTNPVRALRIFQDQASLSANPALWPTIENALGSAEWFILLASPEAANSPWVEKEIDFWRRNKPVECLLIVQTDGEIAWDTTRTISKGRGRRRCLGA